MARIKNIKKDKAFTLIEFIVYFATTTVILGFLILMFLNLLDSREEVRVRVEIASAGRFISETLSRAVFNAYEIIEPEESLSAGESLKLRTSEITEDEDFGEEIYELVTFVTNSDNALLQKFIQSVDEVETETDRFRIHPNNIAVSDLEFNRFDDDAIFLNFTLDYTGHLSRGRSITESFRLIINRR